MDAFDFAYEEMIKDEGGRKSSRMDGDPGGQTYAGIARSYHPKWPGWQLVDAGQFDSPRLEQLTKEFYRNNFWNVNNCDKLPMFLAYHLFDFSVNSNPKTAARKLQEVVGCKIVDGAIGEKETIPRTWAVDEFCAIVALNSARLLYLASLKNWSLFGAGWTNRVAGNLQAEAVRRSALHAATQAQQTAPRSGGSSA